MGEIVNLRLARKRKLRSERETAAEQNRTLHGCTKSARLTEEAIRQRELATHDGHRREGRDDADGEK